MEADNAAYEREESCGNTRIHEPHLHNYGEYVYLCPGDEGPPERASKIGADQGSAPGKRGAATSPEGLGANSGSSPAPATSAATRFPLLTREDVSHDKLRELLDRMLAATRSGKIAWQEHHDGSLDYAVPSGVVDVSERGVKVYDDRGRELRRVYPGDDSLYEAARGWFDGMRSAVLDRLLAELEAM